MPTIVKDLAKYKFLGSQALPLREHGHSEINFSFNQLSYLFSENNPLIKKLIKRKGHKYTCGEIQKYRKL